MKKIVLALVLAAVLWGIMFSPLTAPHVPFWGMMAASACVLAVFAFVVSPDLRRMRWRVGDCFAGIAIAVGLWCVFWVGDQVSSRLFDFARPQVDLIYGMKEGVPAGLLSVLLLFLIGPAEELFWRGYVQGTLSQRWGANAAFVVTVLAYALVHVPSCNFMLVMAAGVAGVVWGGLYRLFPRRLAALWFRMLCGTLPCLSGFLFFNRNREAFPGVWFLQTCPRVKMNLFGFISGGNGRTNG